MIERGMEHPRQCCFRLHASHPFARTSLQNIPMQRLIGSVLFVLPHRNHSGVELVPTLVCVSNSSASTRRHKCEIWTLLVPRIVWRRLTCVRTPRQPACPIIMLSKVIRECEAHIVTCLNGDGELSFLWRRTCFFMRFTHRSERCCEKPRLRRKIGYGRLQLGFGVGNCGNRSDTCCSPIEDVRRKKPPLPIQVNDKLETHGTA